MGEARGSQPASAWAARADSDSAAEAFASAFPPCARPGRLPLRAPTRFHLLESWGQGEKDPAIDEVSDSGLSPPGSPPAPTTRAAKRRDPTPAAPASPHAHAELDCHSPPELPESPPAPAELSRAVGLPGGSSIPNRPSASPHSLALCKNPYNLETCSLSLPLTWAAPITSDPCTLGQQGYTLRCPTLAARPRQIAPSAPGAGLCAVQDRAGRNAVCLGQRQAHGQCISSGAPLDTGDV